MEKPRMSGAFVCYMPGFFLPGFLPLPIPPVGAPPLSHGGIPFEPFLPFAGFFAIYSTPFTLIPADLKTSCASFVPPTATANITSSSTPGATLSARCS